MSKKQLREITLDTETTGLNPYEGHKIVEIGCVELINRVRTGNTFHVYINPCIPMPQEAFNIHGLSSEFLSDKPLFPDVVKDFLAFIQDDSLVIHNAPFDMRFLNKELENVGLPLLTMDKAIDTLQLARKKFPGSQATLDALCRRYNIDLSKRTKHGALLDADLLVDVYVELMGGAQSAMFSDTPILRHSVTELKGKVKDYPRREATAVTIDELEAHKELQKKLKKPVWEN